MGKIVTLQPEPNHQTGYNHLQLLYIYAPIHNNAYTCAIRWKTADDAEDAIESLTFELPDEAQAKITILYIITDDPIKNIKDHFKLDTKMSIINRQNIEEILAPLKENVIFAYDISNKQEIIERALLEIKNDVLEYFHREVMSIFQQHQVQDYTQHVFNLEPINHEKILALIEEEKNNQLNKLQEEVYFALKQARLLVERNCEANQLQDHQNEILNALGLAPIHPIPPQGLLAIEAALPSLKNPMTFFAATFSVLIGAKLVHTYLNNRS